MKKYVILVLMSYLIPGVLLAQKENKELVKAKLAFNEGVIALEGGQPRLAESRFEGALFMAPEFALPYLEKAKLLILDEFYEQALELAEQAVERDAEYGEAY